jgi:hypothetical protein
MPVRFLDSAMKHGLTEEEIIYVIENADGHVKNFTDPQPPATIRPDLYIGPRSLTDHTPIEVFLEVRGTLVTIFHAMPAQEKNLNRIGRSYL